MKTLLIGTTATNRSLLHKDCISGWYEYIKSLDPSNYTIKWFINIDYIEKLGEEVSHTENHFRSLIQNIDTVYLTNPGKKGDFLQACKKVSEAIESYVKEEALEKKDVIVFWLEDDWKLHPQNIGLEELLKNYMTPFCYINLSFIRANYIHALAPSLISYALWSKLHLTAWKEEQGTIDPEHCVGKYYLDHFGKYEELSNITLINAFKKHDAGFFQMKMFESAKSYYTYDKEKESNIINEKYIAKEALKDFVKDDIVFIRITTSCCADKGREFMKNINLVKKKHNTSNDFYT